MGEGSISHAALTAGITPAARDAAMQGQGAAHNADQAATATAALPAAPPATALDPAVTLASRLAHLFVGQMLEGSVEGQDGEGHALLKTLVGAFAVDPSHALPRSGSVSLVVTRLAPDLSAVLISRAGEALPRPEPVRLTLVTLDASQLPDPQGAPPLADRLQAAMKAMPQVARAAMVDAPVEGIADLAGHEPFVAPPRAIPDSAQQRSQATRLEAPAPVAAPVPRQAPAAARSWGPAQNAIPGEPLQAAAVNIHKAIAPEARQAWQRDVHLQLVLDAPEGSPAAAGPLAVRAMLLALSPAADRTPLTAPATGSPLATLMAAGRIVLWQVSDEPQTGQAAAPLRLINPLTGQRATLAAPAPLPAGTQISVMMIDRPPPGPAVGLPVQDPAVPALVPPASAPVAGPVTGLFDPLAVDDQAMGAILRAAMAAGSSAPESGGPPAASASLPGLVRFVAQALGLKAAPLVGPAAGDRSAEPAVSAAVDSVLMRDAVRTPAASVSDAPVEQRLSVMMLRADGLAPLPAVLIFEPARHDRQSGGSGKDQADEREQRFAVVVDYPRIGSVRLDGVAAPGQLMLSVRTPVRLPDGLMDSTRDVFARAIEAAGLRGGVTFRV